MPPNTAQELYDKAFQYWQQNDSPKATEFINQALTLAPEDLTVHALAVHIKTSDLENLTFLPHAEFIMDHDIHYRDTLDSKVGPNAIIYEAFWGYSYGGLRRHLHTNTSDEDSYGRDLDERICKYAKIAISAGYPIPEPKNYLEALMRLKRYEEVVNTAAVLLKVKSGTEAELPGLEKVVQDDFKDADDIFSIIDLVSKTYYELQRNEEACEFFKTVTQTNPNEWLAHSTLGEIYAQLDQPEETARQWILASVKRGWHEYKSFDFINLCKLAADPMAGKKTALLNRIWAVFDAIPDENIVAAKNIRTQCSIAIGEPDTPIMNEELIESKIGIKLPPETQEHYETFGRLWLPGTQGEHPYAPRPSKAQSEPEQDAVVKIIAGVPMKKLLIIEKFGIDITELARLGKLPPITGRDEEIDSLVRILLRMEKNNPVLLGSAGVGKTAIIHGLAQRIVSENVPLFLKNKRVFELSMSGLVSGTTFRGDFEQRMTGIIEEARQNPDIILFVDELHTIMGAGAAARGDLDAANIVKPALAKGTLRLAGATTTQEYGKCIEKDPAMARRFTPVRVGEMDRAATIEVLRKRRDLWREHHKVEISDEVLLNAVELVDLQVKNRNFPDKAIDLLDEACAFTRSRRAPEKNGLWQLRTSEVQHVLQEWTGGICVPVNDTPDKQTIRIPSVSDIATNLRTKIIGQENAVLLLSQIVVQLRLSLKDPDAPISLLFYGPSGSGKTTCCEALGSTLWPDDNDRLLPLNFLDYADPLSLFRLIGSPPGYGAQDGGGVLSARLKRQPRSIIVMRNFADAHSSVHRFFEQLLKFGVFTDSTGRKIIVSNTVFIIHVNTTHQSRGMGFGTSNITRDSTDHILDNLSSNSAPGLFRSLLTHLVSFNELSIDTVMTIIEMRLNSIRNSYVDKGIRVCFDKTLVRRLADTFLKLPAEKRGIESLVNKEIGPRIRDAVLARTDHFQEEIEIR